MRTTGSETHAWHARLDSLQGSDDCLSPAERERAARIISPTRRRRWIASRWALRTTLGRYLDQDAKALEFRIDAGGKPRLAGVESLHFNLSHSADLALIVVSAACEVGVDLERVGERPRDFYEAWVRREAVGKCFGGGLREAPPTPPCQVLPIELGTEWVAALAVAGRDSRPVRRFELR
jgi:phosphopantetheinyl transferase